MNIRSLTRGDGVVIGAAVVLFIASFLDLTSYGNQCSGSYCANLNNPSAWDSLGTLMSIYLAGVIGAALITVARALPQPRKVAGLDMAQFGVAFTIFAAWTGFWTLVDASSRGAGLILGFIAALVLAGAAVAGPMLPALKGPLMSAPKPAAVTPSPYGVQAAGAPGQGYGYPGAQAQQPYGAQPQPGQPQPAFGAQAAAHPGQPQDTHQPTAAQPQPSADAPAGEFAPFWFAVPVARPLYGEDGSPAPIAELAPGTWYLAVEQRGPGLIAQTQDGRRGVLQDTTGIQRG
ncbi:MULTISPECIES: hypothetical protein [unclassified Streptomyces]|uniref:hypothetical protein n=1 Tax=unclassified Streptomyces TaxID=2593676 RepID=UPI002E0E8BC5|nr:DUF5336 domain-containing protein [Streptomyces sp. NBC_01197]WSS48832.1 DUF5336 domain-containing protein [Streptomyces sp. NBC_01180]